MKKLVRNMVRYRMIEKHLQLVREGKYDVAHYIIRLLNKRECTVGLGDDAGYVFEITAENCGCRISYSRNYNLAHIRI